MGLTIHYKLSTASTSSNEVRKIMIKLHLLAKSLPSVVVSDLGHFIGPDCNYENADAKWKWSLIQAVQYVDVGRRSISVIPEEIFVFTIRPKGGREGHETMEVGLARYPDQIEYEECGCSSIVPTNLGNGWQWSGFCKTQSAARVSLKYFLYYHTLVCAMLRLAENLVTVEVYDEGGFWGNWDLEALVKEVEKWNEGLAKFLEVLKKEVPNPAAIVSPAYAHPEYYEQAGLEPKMADHPGPPRGGRATVERGTFCLKEEDKPLLLCLKEKKGEWLSDFLLELIIADSRGFYCVMDELIGQINAFLRKNPEADLTNHKAVFNYAVQQALENGTFWDPILGYRGEYTPYYDRNTLITIWRHLFLTEGTDNLKVLRFELGLPILGKSQNTPPEILEEIFNSIVDEMLGYANSPGGSALTDRMYKLSTGGKSYNWEALLRTFIRTIVGVMENPLWGSEFVAKIMPPADVYGVKKYIASFEKWALSYVPGSEFFNAKPWVQSNAISEILGAILDAPYTTPKEWKQIYNFTMTAGRINILTNPMRILLRLSNSTAADPEGLLELWKYSDLRYSILSNPATPKYFINEIIDDISTKNSYGHLAKSYCTAMTYNPAIKSTDLIPLLLSSRTDIPREVIKKRIKDLQEEEASGGFSARKGA